jgi:endonuclease/exonuclease/phosphatase family metal-dependent hydrolase
MRETYRHRVGKWRRLGLVACTAVLVGGLILGPAQARPKAQKLTAMSYNIFQGTELSNAEAAKSLSQLGPAVGKDYQNVIKSNIPARAKALAAAIKANAPDLVGLQEAVLWRTAPAGASGVTIPPNATHVAFDSVKLIVGALAAKGAHYSAVAITDNFDIQATADFPNGKKMDVRITDRVAILARKGVTVSNVQEHNFVAHDSVSVIGFPFAIKDGWASVDAKVGGKQLRFITTHLDGINGSMSNTVRANEANEIIKGPATTPLPVVFTCDCNAKPGTTVYTELKGAGLRDTWAALQPHSKGLTCCHRSSPKDPEVDVADPHPKQGIVERLDYIWSHAPLKALAISLLGTKKADRTKTKPPLWPSDHLGLVATLQF